MKSQQSDQSDSRHERPGLITGLAGIAKNAFALLITRIELAALELGEMQGHLLQLVVVFTLAITAICFALVYWTVALVFLTWESLGWKILPMIAAGFTVLAIGLFLYARSAVRCGALSLPATMAELRRDRDAFNHEVKNDE
jgi:uncharacterized membrane protein YqjE